MKKSVLLILVIILVVSMVCFSSCTKQESQEKTFTLVAPDGATAFALTSFIKDSKLNENVTIEANIVSASQISIEAAKADLAVVPVNLAAKMYNNGANIKVISTITNGNLYLMSSLEKNDFTLNDLKGNMLYTIGQAAVPSMILLDLLKLNNIEYVESDTPVEGKVAIKYCNDGPSLLPYLVSAKNSSKQVYGMLADPAVTNAVKSGKAFEVLDIQKEYQKATNSEVYGFAQAVLIAKSEIAKDEKLVKDIVLALQNNDTYVASNAQEAYNIIANKFTQTTLPKNISNDIVLRCNLKAYRALDYKEYIKTTLDSIYNINSKAVGEVPSLDSGFYA